MKACVIISGGEFCPLPDYEKEKYIIACDKGVEYAGRQGVVPNLIIGDFDSYDCEKGLPEGVPVERYPSEKDDTDTMIALKTALELGYRDITVYCGFGGRLDHLYANFQTSVHAAEHGALCRFVDERNEVFAMNVGAWLSSEEAARSMTYATVRITAREGWSLSVFAVSDVCRGVTIKGTKYEVENADLTNGFPLGVSNQWKDGQAAMISVQEGTLLIIMSKLG